MATAEQIAKYRAEMDRMEREQAEWAASYGLTKARRDYGCLCGIRGKRGPCYGCDTYHRWLDHGRLFLRGRKPAVMVSFVYGLSSDDLRSILAAAKQYSLEVDINPHSMHGGDNWYGHGTTMVVLWTAEADALSSQWREETFGEAS